MAQYSYTASPDYRPGDALYDADEELSSLYAAITGRKAFTYNPNTDPMYRSYADRYVQNGRMAMRDTIGQAAALTGGYGSTYAQSAGQQQYGEYLRALGEVMPELYGLAYRQYADQGAALQNAWDMSNQRREAALSDRETAYQRGRDELADARYEAEWQAKQEQTAFQQRQTLYANLVAAITGSGYVPSDEELEQTGLSREAADALRTEYLRAHKLLKKKSSGGGSGSGSGSAKVGKAGGKGGANALSAGSAR